MLTTIGSYDKLMEYNRRCILTYNDTFQSWREYYWGQLPVTVKTRVLTTIHIPVGDIAECSVLTLKFSADSEEAFTNPPSVYVNSSPCKYVGEEECEGVYTRNSLLCYEIPASAYGDTYITAEILSKVDFTADYAEVYIDVTK